ncbi:MAG TPA: hypothetical protein VKX25_00875 [Bryobacteraceae bacterium]|jgi:hypothetical protein|nr:hypothetical protein [Bryobacteraceae bacterium]
MPAEHWICFTCGTQYAASEKPPDSCAICTDPRQFVGFDGQQWTTLAELRKSYRNEFVAEEPGVHSFHTQPDFAIGQRAFLIQTEQGNILWDCLSLLDERTEERIRQLGGIHHIAISHPHYYTTMLEWSTAFDRAPIHLHEADRRWAMRTDGNVDFWRGETLALGDSVTLLHTPGHFAGFQVLHWSDGADRKGALFCGDQPQVCMDRRWVSFLYSYPNYIPLGAREVDDIVRRLDPWAFDRIYGAFPKRTVASDAHACLHASAERYRNALLGVHA